MSGNPKDATMIDWSWLAAYMEEQRAIWKVPGVAVAIVQGDAVTHSVGYGLRDIAKNLPMTPRTVCPLASVTKSMTVATLAVLAREGKLDWDTPVREYMPDFRLFDPVATDRVTPRDLVTHRTGLPRHDGVWYGADLSRDEIFNRLRYLEPSKDLRAAYQYNNLMFMAAGLLAGRLVGTSWEEAIQRLLFGPVGMTRSGCSIDTLLAADDFATGYEEDDAEAIHPAPYYNGSKDGVDPLGPAGSVVSSVEDLIRYVRMQMNGGRIGETTVITASDAAQMQSPQMVIPDAVTWPELGHSQYGMGFSIGAYRGYKTVQHGGNLDGFSTNVAFLPDAQIGVAILCNLSATPLRAAIAYRVFDALLGLEPVDWSGRYLRQKIQSKAAEETAKAQGLTPRKSDTRPAYSVDSYVGSYEHPAYGTVVIRPGASADTLEVAYHGFASPLLHFHFEVWETPKDKRNRLQRTRIAFDTGWAGDIESLRIGLEPQVGDIVFTRIADTSMHDRSFLAKLAGVYIIGDVKIRIELLDSGTLQITQPGQTPRALLPVRDTTFDIEGQSGYRAEFVRAESEAVTGLALHTPGGTYLAEREPA